MLQFTAAQNQIKQFVSMMHLIKRKIYAKSLKVHYVEIEQPQHIPVMLEMAELSNNVDALSHSYVSL
jgi:nitrate reductase assembly molybdenum cofactor insertion protein NarJ